MYMHPFAGVTLAPALRWSITIAPLMMRDLKDVYCALVGLNQTPIDLRQSHYASPLG
jgi:hypothetical protein